MERGALRLVGGAELVEDVVGALGAGDLHDARALQQVGADGGAADAPVLREVDLHVLAEAARVVVAHRLGVACAGGQRSGG
eukprot:scaffold165_cov265-Prasinococcus_capsulatus_cf.AAC.6